MSIRMGDRSPYQVLGVSQDATFEEIQTARDRLLEDAPENTEQQVVEQAYDAILMQRLKLRQEGKIPVPEGIRFPQRTAQNKKSPMPAAPPVVTQTSNWLTGFIDTPSTRDILLPLGLLAILAVISSFDRNPTPPTWILSLGFCLSTYFLFIKERRFFRALGLATLGLVLGLLVASAFINGIGFAGNAPSVAFITPSLFVLWIVTAFLR